ncbi:MAG: hypothetical protein K2X66_01015 [Cyanobacteria bacterium]|nr:hypothetical protein [Cyanobacteriota bacterium]
MSTSSSLVNFMDALPEEFEMGTKWMFVGIDLAPNEALETGVAVLDRNRHLTRMDKLYSDQDILYFLKNLAPAQNLIVSLDIPKSLSIPGKWRQEEIKMHPLRLSRNRDEVPLSRLAPRGKSLYHLIDQEGILIFTYSNYFAKMSYDLNIPFRTRTPQGCRALQSLMKTRLRIANVPTNLAPSSVLDAMIGAYASWSVYRGRLGTHFKLEQEIPADITPKNPAFIHLHPVKRFP